MGRSHTHEIAGKSPVAEGLRTALRRAGGSKDPVLLLGEPGCGKAFVAQAIHDMGPRRARPFRHLDCARWSARELERRLAGNGDVAGLLARARGGTVYLGSIEELPPPLQTILLDAIQGGSFRRPEGAASVRVDAKIIVGTAKDLGPFVNGGLFSPRLYELLSARAISVPPLRRRPEDIPEIVADLCGGEISPRLDRSVLDVFQRYPWPGNLEELREEVERLLRTGYSRITIEHVRRDITGFRRGAGANDPKVQLVLEELETAMREFRMLGWLDREFGEFLLDLDEMEYDPLATPLEDPQTWDCDPA
ncbi:MAG: sigma-54-dependent Fis family transcriptional regulator [Planctomycetes bacterium]|nr:sigma-54-dependent Fis family transcriptional regulator [Planctomycetota bacterium]